MDLPEILDNAYRDIAIKFSEIREKWKFYEEEIIPEDPAFAKEVVSFIVSVLDYMYENYDQINVKEYQDFITTYWYDFYYGPNGDDNNYLWLDEADITSMLQEEASVFTKKELAEKLQNFKDILEMFPK
jgi:hypothetical protein